MIFRNCFVGFLRDYVTIKRKQINQLLSKNILKNRRRIRYC